MIKAREQEKNQEDTNNLIANFNEFIAKEDNTIIEG